MSPPPWVSAFSPAQGRDDLSEAQGSAARPFLAIADQGFCPSTLNSGLSLFLYFSLSLSLPYPSVPLTHTLSRVQVPNICPG